VAQILNEQYNAVLGKSLQVLSDGRVLIPADGNDAIADLKNLLRLLMSMQVLLIEKPQEDQQRPEGPKAVPNNGKKKASASE